MSSAHLDEQFEDVSIYTSMGSLGVVTTEIVTYIIGRLSPIYIANYCIARNARLWGINNCCLLFWQEFANITSAKILAHISIK